MRRHLSAALDAVAAFAGKAAPRAGAASLAFRPGALAAIAATLAAALTLPLASGARASTLGIPGCNGQVNALLAHEGMLYAGGAFTLAGGQPAGGIARWDGAAWTALGSGVAGVQTYWDMYGDTVDVPPQVHCLAVYGGQLVAGGSFTSAGGVPAASIARWDGAAWHPLGDGMPDPVTYQFFGRQSHSFPPVVHCLAVWQGELYAGGVFASAGDSVASAIARWDGSTWKRVGTGVAGAVPPRVLAFADDGFRLLAAGDFRVAGVAPAERVAAWDGARWSAAAVGGPDAAVHALLFRDGELVVGGEFARVGNLDAPRLARWDGQAWSGFGGGAPPNVVHTIWDLAGWLHVGAWAHAGGRWVNRLQTDGPVLAAVPWGDGVAFGGRFHTVGPQVGWNVEKWPQQPTAAPPLELPSAPRLTAIAPNPLNPGTRISFSLPRAGPVSLAIFDARGRRVAILLERDLPAGEHAARWDGRAADGSAAPSGVYLARLRTPEGAVTGKLVVAR